MTDEEEKHLKAVLKSEYEISGLKGNEYFDNGFFSGFLKGADYIEEHPSKEVIYSILRDYFLDLEAPEIQGTGDELEATLKAAAEYLANKLK